MHTITVLRKFTNGNTIKVFVSDSLETDMAMELLSGLMKPEKFGNLNYQIIVE